MKSRGNRLEHRAVVDERGHQRALLHRPFRPTEVRRFGEGHSGRMPVVDNQNNWSNINQTSPRVQLRNPWVSSFHCPFVCIFRGGFRVGGEPACGELVRAHTEYRRISSPLMVSLRKLSDETSNFMGLAAVHCPFRPAVRQPFVLREKPGGHPRKGYSTRARPIRRVEVGDISENCAV